MMRGTPVEGTQVHVGAGGLREALKEILDKLDLKIADALRCDFRVYDAKGPAAEIDGGGSKSLVHGHEEISGAQDAALRTESFLYGFAKGDADIFDGVMLVHVEIAAGLHLQIECAVTRDEFEHVVEEANSRRDACFSTAIQIHLQMNVGLVRLAMDCGGAWHFDLSDARILAARFPLLSNGLQQAAHFGVRSDSDSNESRPDIFATVAEKDALGLELSKERGAGGAEIGQQEIAGTWIRLHAKADQLHCERCAQTLHIFHVRLHCGAVAHCSIGGRQSGEIDREGRHSAPHKGERVFASDDCAKSQRSESGHF